MSPHADLAAAARDLSGSLSGRLMLPDHAAYDATRRIQNGLVDKRPAVIVQCRGAADVADAIDLARRVGLDVSVRGGGHNVAGRAVADGGVMIDLSEMRGVRVDAAARRAVAEGGATWRDFNRETQRHGLATTGGVVGSTGVAGLTLGGGFGWLMPRYGMSADNLLAADMVLADGRIVRASEDEHPDLFWAIRGGGGNFGVAASLEFRLHPVGPMVTGGLVAWPFDQARAVMRFFRDFTTSVPDEMLVVAAMLTAPDGTGKLVGVAAGHCGPAADGEAAVQPIKSFGSPVMDAMGPIPYVALNGMLDGAFPKGARNYWKSHFLSELSDAAIDAAVDRFAACPTPMGQMLFEHFHGAGPRVPAADTAYAMRGTGINTLVLAQWMDPAADAACIGWARDTSAAVRPLGGSRRYLNYLDEDDAGEAALAAAYGPNIGRLREVKRTYDPGNVFRHNQNIAPA